MFHICSARVLCHGKCTMLGFYMFLAVLHSKQYRPKIAVYYTGHSTGFGSVQAMSAAAAQESDP